MQARDGNRSWQEPGDKDFDCAYCHHDDAKSLLAEDHGHDDSFWLIVKPDMDTYTFATSRQLDFPVSVKM